MYFIRNLKFITIYDKMFNMSHIWYYICQSFASRK